MVTVDGHIYLVGDTHHEFTIQSISKVLTYGLAIHARGIAEVNKRIGVEPSGEAFNSISLEPDTGRPMNPMINTGAIATTNMIPGNGPAERLGLLLDCFGLYAGRKLRVDESVYTSEKITGHRNRAIAHMLVNYGIIEGDPEPSLDLYFKQCSVLVSCRDLAVVAATLANQGVNPLTGVRAIDSKFVPRMLSVMASCGMYDSSGSWIYDVGMPAKSGVGGGIMAVLPAQFGLAVFSPPLDARGNSVRGIAVCKAMSSDFGLHMLQPARATSGSVIRRQYDLSEVGSKRKRRVEPAEKLAAIGSRALVMELAGDLVFTSAEIVLSEAMAKAGALECLILDLRRISSVETAAIYLLVGLARWFIENQKQILFTSISQIFGLEIRIRKNMDAADSNAVLRFEDLDNAIEWCEDHLLDLDGTLPPTIDAQDLCDQFYCRDFTAEELQHLQSLVNPRHYGIGTYLCREREHDPTLHFIIEGDVSVLLRIDSERSERLATLSAGDAVGEASMVIDSDRSADVIADTEVKTLALDYAALEQDPAELARAVASKLIRNIAVELSIRLRRANQQIRSLTR